LLTTWRKPRQHSEISVSSQPARSSEPESPGTNRVIARSPSATGTNYVPAGRAEIRLYDSGTDYLLTGKVRTEEDGPAAGALVSLYLSRPEAPKYEWPPIFRSQSCDADGSYLIRLDGPIPVGSLVIDEAGYALLEDICDVRVPGNREKDYVLTKAAGCVEGRVLDEGGARILGAGVSITAMRLGSGNDLSHIFPTTKIANDSGSFLIDRLPEGPRQVNAFARGFLRTSQTIMISAGPCAALDFNLKPARAVSFTVKSQNGLPLTNATAVLSRSEPPFTVGAMLKGSEVGRLEWNAPLDAGPAQCSVSASGFKTKTFALDPKDPPADVVLEEGDVFSGLVLTEAGTPLAGAQVNLIGSGALRGPVSDRLSQGVVTDHDGRFSVHVSFAPVHQVRVKKEGYAEQNIVLETEPPAKMLEIRLQRADTGIFGRVVDEEGKPVHRFSLYFHYYAAQSALGVLRWFDNEEGAFFVADLNPGTCEMVVSTDSIPPQKAVLKQLEIKKGFYFGELLMKVSPPAAPGK
jgi:hypothetical protein